MQNQNFETTLEFKRCAIAKIEVRKAQREIWDTQINRIKLIDTRIRKKK